MPTMFEFWHRVTLPPQVGIHNDRHGGESMVFTEIRFAGLVRGGRGDSASLAYCVNVRDEKKRGRKSAKPQNREINSRADRVLRFARSTGGETR